MSYERLSTAASSASTTPSRKPPEDVERKVGAMLNELVVGPFDTISNQIIGWANNNSDARTMLSRVVHIVFGTAIDDEEHSELYARLCRKMMEKISPSVHDDRILNSEGKPIAGGQLFRKYLLNRCQEDFERASKDVPAAAAAATRATEDQAAKAAAEEESPFSEEYAAQKAKRQGLGLVKFLGELFKLQILAERIMHECLKKFLGNVQNPAEEDIESLCKLLTTVGQVLDTANAQRHMNVYFAQMKELTKSPNVNSRMRFMLQDVIDLRGRKWIARSYESMAAPPRTVAASSIRTHEKEADRNLNVSLRGGDCEYAQASGPDGEACPPAEVSPSFTAPSLETAGIFRLHEIDWALSTASGHSDIFVELSGESVEYHNRLRVVPPATLIRSSASLDSVL